jgi:hypothetical protein
VVGTKKQNKTNPKKQPTKTETLPQPSSKSYIRILALKLLGESRTRTGGMT